MINDADGQMERSPIECDVHLELRILFQLLIIWFSVLF